MSYIVRGLALVIRQIATAIAAMVVLVLYLALVVSGFFEKDIVGTTFRCKDPCVVDNNHGGNPLRFWLAAWAVHRGDRQFVVIDGPCFSSCAMFADMARPKVLVTTRAIFGFHQGGVPNDPFLTFNPIHAEDIRKWADKKGGFPPPEQPLLYMNAKEARLFWPLTQLNPPLPKKRSKLPDR